MRQLWSTMMYLVAATALVCGTRAAVAESAAQTQPIERAKVCMLEDMVQTKPGIEHTVDGKTYYVCCPMCTQRMDAEPERYTRAHDPVSGKTVDKATAPLLAYKEKAYYFATEESRAAFAKDPERYVRSVSGEQNKNP